jgi:hypothetical protein
MTAPFTVHLENVQVQRLKLLPEVLFTSSIFVWEGGEQEIIPHSGKIPVRLFTKLRLEGNNLKIS